MRGHFAFVADLDGYARPEFLRAAGEAARAPWSRSRRASAARRRRSRPCWWAPTARLACSSTASRPGARAASIPTPRSTRTACSPTTSPSTCARASTSCGSSCSTSAVRRRRRCSTGSIHTPAGTVAVRSDEHWSVVARRRRGRARPAARPARRPRVQPPVQAPAPAARRRLARARPRRRRDAADDHPRPRRRHPAAARPRPAGRALDVGSTRARLPRHGRRCLRDRHARRRAGRGAAGAGRDRRRARARPVRRRAAHRAGRVLDRHRRARPGRLAGRRAWPTTAAASATGAGSRRAIAGLDLGEVRGTAEVFVDGVSAGVRVCSPYRFEVTPRPARRSRSSCSTRSARTSTRSAPRRTCSPGQRRSGLFGPVRATAARGSRSGSPPAA